MPLSVVCSLSGCHPGCLQADKGSPLENKAVDRSSKLLVGASALGTAALTVLSFS